MKKIISRMLYSLSVFTLLVVSAPLAGASTPFPGKNGQLAFVRESNHAENIWIMNENGGHKRALTHAGAENPVWSPNGRKIAFVSTTSHQLLSMNGDGTARRDLIYGFAGNESSPVWSRDGRHIAFVREKTDENGKKRSAVFTVTSGGTNEANVSGWSETANYRSPSWSPDSTRLTYEQYNETAANLLITNVTTAQTGTLTSLSQMTDSAEVAWSPSGKKILFKDSANEIYTIWPDGSHKTVISDGDSYEASWSPDGTRIAFLEDFDGEDISISNADGEVVQVPIGKRQYHEIGAPTWSPNGKKLVFTLGSNSHTTRVGRPAAVFTVDVSSDRFAVKKIAEGYGSDFSWQAVR